MLKKLRKNKKGFTLAELLIVVAIIGVLVAISIPIFTTQLKKARLATNQSNARAAYAAATADFLITDEDTSNGITYKYTTTEGTAKTASGSGTSINMGSAPIADWNYTGSGTGVESKLGDDTYTQWYVALDKDGTVTSISADK